MSLQAVLLFINVHVMLTVRADQSGDSPANKKKKIIHFWKVSLVKRKANKFQVRVNGRGTGCCKQVFLGKQNEKQ